MSKFRLGTLQISLAVALFTLSGCGEPGIGTVPASGVVLVDGKPITGVMVTFHPDGAGRAASASTDAEGKFKLTTITNGDGALPGLYKISVSKHENPVDDLPKYDPNDPKSLDAIYSKVDARKKVKSKNLVAAQYENPLGSGLTAEIKASGPNEFKFDVKSK